MLGADTKSIKNLKKNFSLNELPLNICYRCPENIIKLAQDLVPAIDWNHDREDKGDVSFTNESELTEKLKPGDVILARRNNDLVRLYKQLVLDNNFSVKFKNSEMVSAIINEIKKVIKEYIRRYNQCLNVEKELYRLCDEMGIDWKKDLKKLDALERASIQKTYRRLVRENKKSSKSISKSNYSIEYLKICMKEYEQFGDYAFTYDGMLDNVYAEYYDVIKALIESFETKEVGILLKDFEAYLEVFLKGNYYENAPILSSIHMMKGGEADNVFIYDYPRFPYIYTSQAEDVQQQEKNLQYVAITRPKKNLYLIRVSRCRSRETIEDIKELNNNCELKVNLLLKGNL